MIKSPRRLWAVLAVLACLSILNGCGELTGNPPDTYPAPTQPDMPESTGAPSTTAPPPTLPPETTSSTTLIEPSGTLKLTEKTEIFPVRGATYRQLTKDLRRASAEASAGEGGSPNEIGWTVFRIERQTSYQCESTKEALSSKWESVCHADVAMKADITIFLPGSPSRLSAKDEIAWKKLVRKVEIHEQGHAAINRESTEVLRRDINEPNLLIATALGDSAKESQNSAIKGIEARLKHVVDTMWIENKKEQRAYHQKVGRYIAIPPAP